MLCAKERHSLPCVRVVILADLSISLLYSLFVTFATAVGYLYKYKFQPRLIGIERIFEMTINQVSSL